MILQSGGIFEYGVAGAVVGAAVGAVVAAVLEQAEAMSAATEINATALRLINIEILTSL